MMMASVKDMVKVLKVLAQEIEAPLFSSSTEGFMQWMLQRDMLVNPAQAMDLEKVQTEGQELLATMGMGSKIALQHIPIWGPYWSASGKSRNPRVFGQQQCGQYMVLLRVR